MPQLLSRISPQAANAPVHWGPEALLKYPQLAALVLQPIAIWTVIDLGFLGMLSNFMQAEMEMVSTMFGGVRLEARMSAIDSAARTRFHPETYDLFSSALGTTQSSRRRRDHFVHHVWGWCEAVPDALLLVDQRELALEHARWLGPAARNQQHIKGVPWDPSKYYVYNEADLRTALEDAQRAQRIVDSLFIMSLCNPPFFKSEKFSAVCNQLAAEPLVAKALKRRSKRSEKSAAQDDQGTGAQRDSAEPQ